MWCKCIDVYKRQTEDSAFKDSDELEITINADGYKPLTFNVVKSGNNYVLKDGTDVDPPAACLLYTSILSIEDWFSETPHIFETNLWQLCQCVFGLQKDLSLIHI